MLIRSRSGHEYHYDVSSNRISSRLDECHHDEPVHFEPVREYVFNRIGMFTIEITQECNLRCTYCCYSGDYSDRRKHRSLSMSETYVNRCIDFIAQHADSEIPVIYVAFYGGEALLQFDKIRRMIQELEKRMHNRSFEFSISTNGILLTPSIIDQICKIKNLFVTITLDGDKDIHDRHRKTVSGTGSFDVIINNLHDFKKRHPLEFGKRVKFISTVKSIQDLIPLNDFWMSSDILCLNRPQHVASIIPNFDKGEKVSTERQKFERIYELGINQIRLGIENIVTDEVFNLIKVVKQRRYSLQSGTVELSTCLNIPNSCFISSDGYLYVCERFCARFKIGSLNGGFDDKRCKAINQMYIDLKNKYCSGCWARRLCRRCAMSLNFTEEQFVQYCQNEQMQLELALQYFCELKEMEKGIFHSVYKE